MLWSYGQPKPALYPGETPWSYGLCVVRDDGQSGDTQPVIVDALTTPIEIEIYDHYGGGPIIPIPVWLGGRSYAASSSGLEVDSDVAWRAGKSFVRHYIQQDASYIHNAMLITLWINSHISEQTAFFPADRVLSELEMFEATYPLYGRMKEPIITGSKPKVICEADKTHIDCEGRTAKILISGH